MGNVINSLDSSNTAFISCVGLGKLCALHCIKVSFYMYHNNFLYLLKRYITVYTFSTMRKTFSSYIAFLEMESTLTTGTKYLAVWALVERRREEFSLLSDRFCHRVDIIT